MSLATDLLEQADHLSRRETKRPKQASLRRSVSCSYYAVFHLLTAEAIRLIGPCIDVNASYVMQRWFDHGDMKRVCGMFSKASALGQLGVILGSPISLDMQTIAQSFIQLQKARHDADYDLAATWTRLTAQQYAQVARDTFTVWGRKRRTHEANVFAVALLSSKLFDRER